MNKSKKDIIGNSIYSKSVLSIDQFHFLNNNSDKVSVTSSSSSAIRVFSNGNIFDDRS